MGERVAVAKRKWVAHTGPGRAPAYREGVAAFLGVDPGAIREIRVSRWGERTGKPEVADIWFEAYRAAMTR